MLLACTVFILISCGRVRRLGPGEYAQWMQEKDNGLLRERMVSGYRFTAKLEPADWLALKEYKSELTGERLDSLKNIYSNTVHITIEAGSDDGKSPLLRAHLDNTRQYFERMHYYTSLVQEDLVLVEGSDTLHCAFYHFEQSFDLLPVNSLIMEFERKRTGEFKDLLLIYNDRMLNTGPIKFHFPAGELNTVPQLVI